MIPLTVNPSVQIYWDKKTDTYVARTNISPELKVDITVKPVEGETDTALYQGLPFEVSVS